MRVITTALIAVRCAWFRRFILPSFVFLRVEQDFVKRSSRVLERALGEREALDVLLDYAADEGDTARGDQGQRLNESITLHEVLQK